MTALRTLRMPWSPRVLLGLCLALGLICLQRPATAQQSCDPATVASSPTSRFSGDQEGHITDGVTQLMWMRCPLGQNWVGKSCQGQAARMSWRGGVASAKRINDSGEYFYNDWRVPSLRDLATVAERKCTQPRINLAVFPGTPAAPFWTATPSLKMAGHVYALDFALGAVEAAEEGALLHVRLVRNAP